jgi:hypothetical protein
MARLVAAKTYFDLSDAPVAKSVLEAHGFVAILFDWHVGSVNWSYMFALNGIRLCTLDVSLPDALRLLDERLETEDPNLGTTVRVYCLICVFLCRTSVSRSTQEISKYTSVGDRWAHRLVKRKARREQF